MTMSEGAASARDSLQQHNRPLIPSPSALPTAQVTEELLSSLLKSVEQLKQDVSRLNAENVSMRSELQLLRHHNNSTFYGFHRLPNEIRHLIWTYALTTPQIHVFRWDYSSFSQVNRVMQACKESREIGYILKLSYYRRRR